MTESPKWGSEVRAVLESEEATQKNQERAALLLEEAIKTGDSEAAWLLGMCCEYGVGTTVDVKRAERLYRRAAEKGSPAGALLATREEGSDKNKCEEQPQKRHKRATAAQTFAQQTVKCEGEGSTEVVCWIIRARVPYKFLELKCWGKRTSTKRKEHAAQRTNRGGVRYKAV